MKTIAIFGSTGTTGLCTLEYAVKQGLSVRALVRNPDKLPEELKKSIEVIQGDVLNYDDVNKCIKGTEGVAVVLGTNSDLKPTTVLSEGMKNIVNAMKENKVEIVSCCLSAFLFYEPSKVPQIFKDLNADHQREFDVLKESGLKYIAILPPHITQEPLGEYTIQHDSSPGRMISKYELGKFLIDSLSQPEHYGRVCGMATKPKE